MVMELIGNLRITDRTNWFYGVLACLGLWQKEAKILFLGLDNAGKTTLLHMLKHERLVQHQPTQYSTSEELSIGKIKFKLSIWVATKLLVEFGKTTMLSGCSDLLGGCLRQRKICRVKERVGRSSIRRVIEHCSVPFLILGNKIDIPYAASEDELRHYLGLANFTTGKGKVNLGDSNVRPLEVFMCSIVRKMGYGEGFKWVSQYIN